MQSISQVPVDASPARVWTYTWTGLDLTTIVRPDGTKWRFEYKSTLPGYMTAMKLESTTGATRVERAWEYNSAGYVTASWRGDVSKTGPNKTELYTYAYPNSTTTTVTDPLGQVATYTLERPPATAPIARVTQIAGPCPGCGFSGTTQFFYADAANPLRATTVRSNGDDTVLAYNAKGRVTTRTEAAGTALARTTTYAYEAAPVRGVGRIDHPAVDLGSGLANHDDGLRRQREPDRPHGERYRGRKSLHARDQLRTHQPGRVARGDRSAGLRHDGS